MYANQPKFTNYFTEIRDRFDMCNLSNISVIFSGITPKSGGASYADCDSGIPFIRSGNIADDVTTADDADVFIKPEVHTLVMANSQLMHNDILIAIVGATIGKVGIYKDTREANINQAIAAVRLNDNSFNCDFVMLYLQSPIGQKYLDYLKRPVARANINLEEIGSIEIPNVSASIQCRLVEFMNIASQTRSEKLRKADALLSGMSDFVCKTLKINLKTETPKLGVGVTMRQLKADKAFNVEYYHSERTITIAAVKAVQHKRLGDCVYFMRDIVSANEGQYLGLAGVQSNTGELSGAEDEATGQAFVFRANDVLYCRLRPYLNKVWKAEYDGVCSTEFHVLRMKCNSVLPEYLSAVMRSTLVLNQSRHMMTGNTHPRITNDDVANLLIPVPDMPMQKKIADEMRIRRDTVRALRAEAETEWAAAKAQFERELLGGTGK